MRHLLRLAVVVCACAVLALPATGSRCRRDRFARCTSSASRAAPLTLTEALVPRVYREIRFDNHPSAVAVPAYSQPGTSGAPIVDLADGLLVGMVIGYASERPDVAAVIPAELIYEALAAVR